MNDKVIKYKIFMAVFCCCCLFFIGTAYSQVAPPPVEDLPSIKKPQKITLSATVTRIAEEYGDVLDQLQDIVHDYHHYFAKINDKYSRKYQAELLKLLTKLEDGTYCGDVDKLIDDLNLLIDNLKSEQKTLKSKNINIP